MTKKKSREEKVREYLVKLCDALEGIDQSTRVDVIINYVSILIATQDDPEVKLEIFVKDLRKASVFHSDPYSEAAE